MTLPQIFAFAIVVAMMGLFVWGRLRYDLVALLALLAAVLTGIVPADKAFSGFSDDIVIIVACALLVSAAVERSGAVETVLRGEGGHSFGMRRRDDLLGLAQDPRPGIAPRQVHGFRQRLLQEAALTVAIGAVAGRTEGLYPLAVGFDQGDVDPIERGAAHQTECR